MPQYADGALCNGRGFKALKQLVKVYFKTKKYDKMMGAYRCGALTGLVAADQSCLGHTSQIMHSQRRAAGRHRQTGAL